MGIIPIGRERRRRIQQTIQKRYPILKTFADEVLKKNRKLNQSFGVLEMIDKSFPSGKVRIDGNTCKWCISHLSKILTVSQDLKELLRDHCPQELETLRDQWIYPLRRCQDEISLMISVLDYCKGKDRRKNYADFRKHLVNAKKWKYTSDTRALSFEKKMQSFARMNRE